jgi:peptidoglycan/xylan/chitin deacetylase (PgdA/CDA1 family)
MPKEILCGYGVDLDAVAGWLFKAAGESATVVDVSRGLFAGEVGTPRLLDLFARFGITASWFVPGHSIETFPRQVARIAAEGHEIGLHGYSHERMRLLSREQETAVLRRSIELVERVSGRRPQGFVAPSWDISPSTIELLIEHGLRYDHSLMAHDFQPHYVRIGDTWTDVDLSQPADAWMRPLVRGRDTDLVEIPASWYVDDAPPMIFNPHAQHTHGYVSPRDIEQLWRDQFDWVYREYDYAIFPITIHPDVSGRPQVLLMHERLIGHMQAQPGVRFVTFAEMAADFRRRQPR